MPAYPKNGSKAGWNGSGCIFTEHVIQKKKNKDIKNSNEKVRDKTSIIIASSIIIVSIVRVEKVAGWKKNLKTRTRTFSLGGYRWLKLPPLYKE